MEILNFKRASDGKQIELRVNEETNYLEWKCKDQTVWTELMSLDNITPTTDYEKLINIPSIEGVQLLGTLELDDLGLIKGWIGIEEEYYHDKDLLPPETVCHITDDSDQDNELYNAYDIEFDNTDTGLVSKNVNDVIIELLNKINNLSK